MQIKSLLRVSSLLLLTGAFFPNEARSAALVRRDDLAATATLAPQQQSVPTPAAAAGTPVGVVSAAAVPEIPEPQISEPGSSSADESPDGSDALAAQTLDPSEDDESPASTEEDSAEPAEEEDADAAPADYHPDEVEEDDGAYPAYAPDDGEEEVSPASTDDEDDASPASAEDDQVAPSSEAPEDDVHAAGVPKTFIPQQQQRHHRRRRIRYSARARFLNRRLGILRDRLSIGGKKGAKKMYGMTYYHKKTSYPIGPVMTAGAAPGTPAALRVPIAPAEELTYKKVRAFRKSGAAARKLAQRIRLLRLRKGLRAHRKFKVRL
ncbi:hypothetical protein HDU96_001907 [Phlyctochytrium bullatum]|nr:hypothetical protein HDU96_001907 [Phlyctochytrium bullatum]